MTGRILATLGLALMLGACSSLDRGKPPTLLGVQGGRLPPPHVTRNNVHSQAAIWGPQYAHTTIDPLPAQADGAQTMQRLRSLVVATPCPLMLAVPVVFVLLSIEMVFRMHRLLHAERGPRQDAVSAA